MAVEMILPDALSRLYGENIVSADPVLDLVPRGESELVAVGDGEIKISIEMPITVIADKVAGRSGLRGEADDAIVRTSMKEGERRAAIADRSYAEIDTPSSTAATSPGDYSSFERKFFDRATKAVGKSVAAKTWRQLMMQTGRWYWVDSAVASVAWADIVGFQDWIAENLAWDQDETTAGMMQWAFLSTPALHAKLLTIQEFIDASKRLDGESLGIRMGAFRETLGINWVRARNSQATTHTPGTACPDDLTTTADIAVAGDTVSFSGSVDGLTLEAGDVFEIVETGSRHTVAHNELEKLGDQWTYTASGGGTFPSVRFWPPVTEEVLTGATFSFPIGGAAFYSNVCLIPQMAAVIATLDESAWASSVNAMFLPIRDPKTSLQAGAYMTGEVKDHKIVHGVSSIHHAAVYNPDFSVRLIVQA